MRTRRPSNKEIDNIYHINNNLIYNNKQKKSQQIAGFFCFNSLSIYRTNFLYLIRFGIKSPPKRFFLFSSYSLKPPSKK